MGWMGIIGLIIIHIHTWFSYIIEDNLEESMNLQVIQNLFGVIFNGMITKYYNALNGSNFLYFLRELEFRYNTRGLNSNMKLRELKEIFDYCPSTCNYDFY